jgi:hypothetical protein
VRSFARIWPRSMSGSSHEASGLSDAVGDPGQVMRSAPTPHKMRTKEWVW